MKPLVGRALVALGYLTQLAAVIGIPTWVIFGDASRWWLAAILPVGIAGVVPISLGQALAGGRDEGD